MKLSNIRKEHVRASAGMIDHDGIPDAKINNLYWVDVDNKEYPFKHLTTLALELADNITIDGNIFQSNDSYRNYIKSLGFDIRYYKEGVNFFSESDLKQLAKTAGKEYRKEVAEDRRNGNLLKPLVYKLNVWAKNSTIEDFIVQEDKNWQRSGHFLPYFWVRNFRPGDSQKVFFIVGIEKDKKTGKTYIYSMLECLRKETKKVGKLSKSSQQAFDAYLKNAGYTHLIIQEDQLLQLTWDQLLRLTKDFYYENLALYDELEALMNEKQVPNSNTDPLEFVDAPDQTKSYLDRTRTFVGRLIDWAKRQMNSKKTGTNGEEFVIENERKKLHRLGLNDLAEKVKPMLDGSGYDVLSYDENGEEMHIEVKTTTGSIDEPFYFSINEKEYWEKHPEKYFLYRLHEFRVSPTRAKCYVLSAAKLRALAKFNATSFEVSIKSSK